jgi:hypothetical protein
MWPRGSKKLNVMKIIMTKDHYSGLTRDTVIESPYEDRLMKLVDEGYAELLSKAPDNKLSTNNPVEVTKELKTTGKKK